MAIDDIPEDRCGDPCPADHACPGCAPYWRRMVDEGLWDPDKSEWTEKAIREATK
jgi:hypothetical protein